MKQIADLLGRELLVATQPFSRMEMLWILNNQPYFRQREAPQLPIQQSSQIDIIHIK